MISPILKLDAGPATLIPLVHVPLLKQAPRQQGEYKAISDSLGDLCHFYGDFSGYHLYFIASTYKKRILPGSLDYFDKKNGKFSASLAVTLDNGEEKEIRITDCQAPLCKSTEMGLIYPESVSIASFSPGTPDALKFHFEGEAAKFKFSNNLVPFIKNAERADYSDFFDFKVEYIGQAVGKDGAREVADRLGSGHSTESAISNEFLHKKTNRELYAILYKPRPLTDRHGAEDFSISFSLVVDVLEKSLIASFRPEKNVQSKNFPNDGSQPALKLIGLGITRLIVSAESPDDYGCIFTDDAAAERKHIFDIRIPEQDRF